MSKVITIAKLNVEGDLEVEKEFNHSLENMQRIVGGYLQALDIKSNDDNSSITMWLNDEGKLGGFNPNLGLLSGTQLHDVVFGNVFFARTDYEGDTVSLTEDDIEYIKEKIVPFHFIIGNNVITRSFKFN